MTSPANRQLAAGMRADAKALERQGRQAIRDAAKLRQAARPLDPRGRPPKRQIGSRQ